MDNGLSMCVKGSVSGMQAWKNVYVFISSTFNDMHAERDYLVKRVFSELSGRYAGALTAAGTCDSRVTAATRS